VWLRGSAGILLCAVGTVFVLQGTNVVRGSGMSGEGEWAVIGAVFLAVGLGFLWLAVRSYRRGPTD
jgi:UDP-N-acetylmuramyl pentapeptide phosphotransferase/UDP-N-acetylglucosamine-1-phosphate transferase